MLLIDLKNFFQQRNKFRTICRWNNLSVVKEVHTLEMEKIWGPRVSFKNNRVPSPTFMSSLNFVYVELCCFIWNLTSQMRCSPIEPKSLDLDTQLAFTRCRLHDKLHAKIVRSRFPQGLPGWILPLKMASWRSHNAYMNITCENAYMSIIYEIAYTDITYCPYEYHLWKQLYGYCLWKCLYENRLLPI